MAVFWFGWTKKLKNIFTKQQADQYYLQKNSNQQQTVAGQVSFSGGVISHSSNEFGTEIKAGYGGGSVKFIPEDNSTKTLQFYNANPTDTRRFNLLVPNPTAAQNPATKSYVDNKFDTNTTNINELKRLTTLKTYQYNHNNAATNWSVVANTVDFTRPVYISFKQSNYDSGVILKTYNYVVNFLEENNWYYLNDNVSIKYFRQNNSYTIEWKSANLPSREVLGYITLKYTPKTL